MSARGPKDEEEHFKALLAVLNGRGPVSYTHLRAHET